MPTGNRSEQVVRDALQKLLENGFITHFVHAKKNGDLDTSGIDFLIFIEGGFCLPLQVKGSRRSFGRHLDRYPHIPAIIDVPAKHTVGKTKIRLKQMIKDMVKTTSAQAISSI